MGNSWAAAFELFLKNCGADVTVSGEGGVTAFELASKLSKKENWQDTLGIAFKTASGDVVVNDKRKGQKNSTIFQ